MFFKYFFRLFLEFLDVEQEDWKYFYKLFYEGGNNKKNSISIMRVIFIKTIEK